MGSLINHNNEDKNSVKNSYYKINYVLYEQNSSACATRFLVHFLVRCPLHYYDVEPPNATFYGGHEHMMMNFPSSF